MDAVEITLARLMTEEGFRAFPYNDKTGKRVTCRPDGNLTWLYGCNLETSGSPGLAKAVLAYQLGEVAASLSVLSWYASLDEPRKSVFLDVGFNDGIHGVLGYEQTISAAEAGQWQTAHDCLLDSDAARKLPSRYQPLAAILLTGVIP